MTTEPLVVVSSDTHIGPRLVEDLRDYCPAACPSRVRRPRVSAPSRGRSPGARGFRCTPQHADGGPLRRARASAT